MVIQTNAADLAKALGSCKGGETIELIGGARNLRFAVPSVASRITIVAVDPVLGAFGSGAGPVQFEGSWAPSNDVTSPAGGYGLRYDAAKGTTVDVVFGQTFRIDGTDASQGTGIYVTGPGKVLIDGGVMHDIALGAVFRGAPALGPLSIEARGLDAYGFGQDLFNATDYQSAYIHDCKWYAPKRSPGWHCDFFQAWPTTAAPNGDLIAEHNWIDSPYQGFTLQDPLGVRKPWAFNSVRIADNWIRGSTLGGVMVQYAKDITVGGNIISTTPDGAFQCSIRDEANWLQSCGTIDRRGNTVTAWTDPSGRMYPAINDTALWTDADCLMTAAQALAMRAGLSPTAAATALSAWRAGV